MEKCVDDIQNVKKLKFEREWAELRLKTVFSDNQGQNIWNKIEKSRKTVQVKESVMSTFA